MQFWRSLTFLWKQICKSEKLFMHYCNILILRKFIIWYPLWTINATKNVAIIFLLGYTITLQHYSWIDLSRNKSTFYINLNQNIKSIVSWCIVFGQKWFGGNMGFILNSLWSYSPWIPQMYKFMENRWKVKLMEGKVTLTKFNLKCIDLPSIV